MTGKDKLQAKMQANAAALELYAPPKAPAVATTARAPVPLTRNTTGPAALVVDSPDMTTTPEQLAHAEAPVPDGFACVLSGLSRSLTHYEAAAVVRAVNAALSDGMGALVKFGDAVNSLECVEGEGEVMSSAQRIYAVAALFMVNATGDDRTPVDSALEAYRVRTGRRFEALR
jgi:hypothetical protein